MMLRQLTLCVLLALLAGPAFAAAKAKEKDTDKAEKEEPAEPALPASMREHGVIGHVPPMEGLPLIDADILARMRERLIVLSQGAGK